MKLIYSAWTLIKQNRRPYILMNAIYYGLVVVCMIYVVFNPELQQTLLKQVGAGLMTGPLSVVGEAYLNARVFTAIALTFFINLVIGSFAELTLPSLIIPFSGLLVGVYRAMLWGLILSPVAPSLRLAMIPHSLTLLIEGQAYILTMLAVYIQARSFLWPGTAGVEGHLKGYIMGLKQTGRIYILVVLTLFVAAVYEVIEVVAIVKLF